MPRQPAFNIPAVTLGAMALLALIHGLREYALTDRQDLETLAAFAFTPARFTLLFDPDGVAEALEGFAQTQAALFFLGDGEPQWWTLVTYSFLHADWTHLGLNALWLAAFGTPVARRFGWLRFILFCLATTLAGALGHYALHAYDFLPMIGASGAVSGLTGACIRFVFQSHGPLAGGYAATGDEAYRLPALSLGGVLRDSRAFTFLAFWLALNVLFGVLSPTLGLSQGPVAWEAHMGGFLAGLLIFGLLDPVTPSSRDHEAGEGGLRLRR